MKENNIIEFEKPSEFCGDVLTELLRTGSRNLLHQAIEAEINELLTAYQHEQDAHGHKRLVRNGYHSARNIQTGIGPIEVQVPRVRDREDNKIKFTPSFLPPYLHRAKNIEELLPVLYLKGISTCDFSEALSALLGKDAPGLSASTISKLKEVWQDEYAREAQRSLSAKHYVYFWVDGIYLPTRLEQENQCLLVIIGADEMALSYMDRSGLQDKKQVTDKEYCSHISGLLNELAVSSSLEGICLYSLLAQSSYRQIIHCHDGARA